MSEWIDLALTAIVALNTGFGLGAWWQWSQTGKNKLSADMLPTVAEVPIPKAAMPPLGVSAFAPKPRPAAEVQARSEHIRAEWKKAKVTQWPAPEPKPTAARLPANEWKTK